MDSGIERSLSEVGHHVLCLSIASGAQLDDIFRLQHLLPYSKFVNDMRGVSINLGSIFSSFLPLLSSHVIGPVNSDLTESFVSYEAKVQVADLLTFRKSEEVLKVWRSLKESCAYRNRLDQADVVKVIEAHNELLHNLVNRTSDFEKPQKWCDTVTFSSVAASKDRIVTDLENYIKALD